MSQNVLFILADQFRADSIGSVGHPVVKTPNLDALISESTYFKQCFVQTAPCGPSRMSMYTSRYPCSHRVLNNKVPLIDAHENIGVFLRNAGHKPAQIGYHDYAVDPRILPDEDPRKKRPSYDNVQPGWENILYHEYDSPEYFEDLRQKGYPEHLLNHQSIHNPNVPPEGPGEHLPLRYPAHYKEEDCECRFITNRAIDHINSNKDRGWVLNVNYIKPHPPNICSAPYNDMYNPSDMPPPKRRKDELESDHPYLESIHKNPKLESNRDLSETQANYWGMITELDRSLGILFQALKDTDQWDKTLILFSSDHGEYLGDHYLTGKGQFYDSTMRVPLIVRDPSLSADATRGQQLDGFVESIDHAPTILEYLGIPIPKRFQGTSILSRLQGSGNSKTEIYYEKDIGGEVDHIISDPDLRLFWLVRDDDYKYVQFASEEIPPLLFDLRNDPDEYNNLANDPLHMPTVLRYCQKLLHWRMKHEDQRMANWHRNHS